MRPLSRKFSMVLPAIVSDSKIVTLSRSALTWMPHALVHSGTSELLRVPTMTESPVFRSSAIRWGIIVLGKI
jgi:hypothetical protein